MVEAEEESSALPAAKPDVPFVEWFELELILVEEEEEGEEEVPVAFATIGAAVFSVTADELVVGDSDDDDDGLGDTVEVFIADMVDEVIVDDEAVLVDVEEEEATAEMAEFCTLLI